MYLRNLIPKKSHGHGQGTNSLQKRNYHCNLIDKNKTKEEEDMVKDRSSKSKI